MNKWLLTLGLVGSAGQVMAAVDTTAPVVTASVAPGSYTSAQKVTLSIKDNSDSAPKLYFTRDGSLPTTASTLYKAGQTFSVVDKGISRDLYLRVLSVDKSGNTRRQSFVYYIDSAPVVTPSKLAGSYNGTQSITLSVKDESDKAPVVYYTTDGSTPSKSSLLYKAGSVISAKATSAAVDLPLRTLAMDSQGNWRRQAFNYVIADADTSAPVTVASLAAGSYTGTQSVSLTITDDKDTVPKAYYTLDGSEPTVGSTAYTKGSAISIAASATLKVLSIDATGNKSVTSFAYVIVPVSTYTWYFRGTPNSWGKTAMTQEGTLFCTVQAFGAASTDPRFKVDHKGDWTENYPSQDYKVTADTTYKICFNPTSKAFTVVAQEGADTKAPTVSATPASGSYTDTQNIKLSITDNKDTAPKLYYTVDGSEPTVASPLYKGETLTARDIVSKGVDYTIRTLAVDAEGNKVTNTFTYYIGASTTAGRDFREETIYFLMTARFYDGDPSNNRYGRADKDAGNVANNDPSWRGDIEGLIKKLDYIKALGFTAVWITPPVLNRSDLDFHG